MSWNVSGLCKQNYRSWDVSGLIIKLEGAASGSYKWDCRSCFSELKWAQ